MKTSESIAKLAMAMAKFQSEVKQPTKDKENPFHKNKYVPLENVVEAITQTAPKYGLSFLQYPINNENKVGVVTMVLHESGEFIEVDPIFAVPPKQDSQATGSTITYLKRYSLSAVFGITSDEDDDGNNGTVLQQKQQYQAPPKQTYQAPPKQQYQAPPKQQYQAPPKQEPSSPEGITPSQIVALKTKLSIVAKKEGKDAKTVFEECKDFCNIEAGKSTKELSKQEAVKIISYLGTLEKQ